MTIFTLRGIPIRLHVSFVIMAVSLVLWRFFTYNLESALLMAFLGLLLFGTVLLHELGHAFTAQIFGIRTKDIILYPFGGMARIENSLEYKSQEFYIALAGPAVNVVVATFSTFLSWLGLPWFFELAVINIIMGTFNLIPAFPMDGGRILRSFLTRYMGFEKATRYSLIVSKFFGWTFVIIGLIKGWIMLVVVGIVLNVLIRSETIRLNST